MGLYYNQQPGFYYDRPVGRDPWFYYQQQPGFYYEQRPGFGYGGYGRDMVDSGYGGYGQYQGQYQGLDFSKLYHTQQPK